jgi:PAS domain S-box-containing protein
MHESSEKQAPGRVHTGAGVTYAYDLNGNLTFLSEEGERISGYTRAEACRMNIAELLDPEIAEHVGEQILRDAKQRVGTVYEVDIIAKDGRRVPLEVSTRVVLRDRETIEVEGIAVPSVIRDPSLTLAGLRCVDRDFFFGPSNAVLDIVIRVS